MRKSGAAPGSAGMRWARILFMIGAAVLVSARAAAQAPPSAATPLPPTALPVADDHRN